MTAAKLRRHGITTVGEIDAAGEERLVELLGRAAGRHLAALAAGRDARPVVRRRRRRSIGAQRALGRRERTPEELSAVLLTLVDRVCVRMRKAGRRCRTVVLRLRFADYSPATRSHTLRAPTAHTRPLLATAAMLLEAARPMIAERGLTLLGVALTNLSDERGAQLTLPFARDGELDRALDAVRERYGSSAVTRATLVGRDPGPWVPLLED